MNSGAHMSFYKNKGCIENCTDCKGMGGELLFVHIRIGG